jgi:hypothetical protein
MHCELLASRRLDGLCTVHFYIHGGKSIGPEDRQWLFECSDALQYTWTGTATRPRRLNRAGDLWAAALARGSAFPSRNPAWTSL